MIEKTKLGSVWKHTFAVVGSCTFPLDMLRYDGCYPEGSQDVRAIVEHHLGIASTDVRGRTHLGRDVVILTSVWEKGWHPTEAQWKSFGWVVVNVDKARQYRIKKQHQAAESAATEEQLLVLTQREGV